VGLGDPLVKRVRSISLCDHTISVSVDGFDAAGFIGWMGLGGALIAGHLVIWGKSPVARQGEANGRDIVNVHEEEIIRISESSG
jgi:hypothetical protein